MGKLLWQESNPFDKMVGLFEEAKTIQLILCKQ